MALVPLPEVVVDLARTEIEAGRPIVFNRDPGPDEVGAPKRTSVCLEILDPLDPPEGIDPESVQVWIAGVLAWTGGAATAGFSGSDLVGGDVLRLEISRALPFDSEEEVEVRVVARTSDDEEVDETWSFVVEDYSAPLLVGAQARGHRLVRLSFSEPVEVSDEGGFLFEAVSPGYPVEAVSATSGGSYVDVTLDTDLSPGATYRATVSGVEDLSANAIDPAGTALFEGFVAPSPAGRRFDLWSMIPRRNRNLDASGTLRAIVAAWQEVVDLFLSDIDRLLDVLDLERTPDAFVDLVLGNLGNPFDVSEMTTAEKRRLASVLVEIYRQKGTAAGIENAIRLFLGREVSVVPLRSGTLVLGVSLLGEDWTLGSSERRVLYSFTIESEETFDDETRSRIRAIVEYMKAAHEHYVETSAVTSDPDHWILGVSLLGESSDLH